jgi:hypothetical protein
MKIFITTVVIGIALTGTLTAHAKQNPASTFCVDAFKGQSVPNGNNPHDLLCHVTLANGKQYKIKEWALYRLFEDPNNPDNLTSR